MPNLPDGVYPFKRKRPAKGYVRRGKKEIKIVLHDAMFQKLRAEALSRGWPVSRMIVFLIEASIDGIE